MERIILDFSGLKWLVILVAAVGKTEDDIQLTPAPFIISFITSLVTFIGLALLFDGLSFTTLTDGTLIELLTGIGFIATAMACESAFC